MEQVIVSPDRLLPAPAWATKPEVRPGHPATIVSVERGPKHVRMGPSKKTLAKRAAKRLHA